MPSQIELENEQLRAALAAAEARIAELEKTQADIIIRIDRVIDSLNNLANDE